MLFCPFYVSVLSMGAKLYQVCTCSSLLSVSLGKDSQLSIRAPSVKAGASGCRLLKREAAKRCLRLLLDLCLICIAACIHHDEQL